MDALSDHIITQVALGRGDTMYAITSTGSLYTLWKGGQRSSSTEVQVNPSALDVLQSKQVRMVVANEDSAICVTTDEEVYAWSHASNDKLSSPKQVEKLDGAKVKLVACDCNGNGIICTDVNQEKLQHLMHKA